MDIKSQKRPRSDTESDSEGDGAWPRFIVISPSEPEKPLKLSPFAIQKGIEGLAGNPKSIRKLRSGDLLVEVSKKAHAKNILNSNMLANIPVKCSPHKGLNSSRGVFRCSELKYCTEAEIKNELKDQGVTDIRRIKSRRNGMLVETNSYIVTFGFPKLPSCIKIGYINCKVEVYIPNPQRCFKCQKFGHSRFTCGGTARCPKCGLDDHGDDPCEGPEKCINCGGCHPAYAKSCPSWKIEKEVQRIKVTQNIGFPEARKMVELTRVPSFSSVLKSQTKQFRSQSTQTDIPSEPQNEISPTDKSKSKPVQVTTKPIITKNTKTKVNITKPSTTENLQAPVVRQRRPSLNRPTSKKAGEDPIATFNKYGVLDNEIELEIDCFHEAMEDHQPAIIDPGGNIPKPSSIKPQ